MFFGVVLRGDCERVLCGMGGGWRGMGRYDKMPAEYVTLVARHLSVSIKLRNTVSIDADTALYARA